MRIAALIVLFIYINLTVAVSQTDTSIKSQLDQILERIKKLETSDAQDIGHISYQTDYTYNLYQNGKVVRRIIVDSIRISNENGYIVDVIIYSARNRFTNGRAPIAMTSDRFHGEDRLYTSSDPSKYIIAQEVLELTIHNNYIPENSHFVLKQNHNDNPLKCSASFNSILDVRLYSDLLGIAGGESNGLAATDIRFKQILHRRNCIDRGYFWLQYFKANVSASKFDSKNKYIDSADFSRSDIMQRNFLSAEVSFNALNGWLFEKKSSHYYFLDMGGGVQVAHYSRRIDSSDLATPYYFIDGGLSLRATDNIGCNFTARYLKHYLPSNQFTLEKGEVEFFRLGVELHYYPISDSENKIFARANYTIPTIRSDQGNAFLQLQLGVSIQLSKLADRSSKL